MLFLANSTGRQLPSHCEGPFRSIGDVTIPCFGSIAHQLSFQLCSQFCSSCWALTFSLIKSMQKSRQNNASTHIPRHGPLFCQLAQLDVDWTLLNIINLAKLNQYRSLYLSNLNVVLNKKW